MNSDSEKDDRREKDQSKEDKAKPEAPKPLPKKIPEPPGNLRRRAEWFRKRSE